MIGVMTEEGDPRAAARSQAFRLFAEALAYPDPPYVEAVRNGQLASALREVLGAVDAMLLDELGLPALREAGEEDDLAVEYTRLFDAGSAGPPCPLYEGVYGGARMKTMEEALRFYNHFGLTLSDGQRELPDHLITQLEFLHYLAFREAEALGSSTDPGPYRRAQRDFIERHPGRWVPMLRKRLDGQSPMPFFLELIHGLERLLSSAASQLAAGA
jgi:DMSO reductase family type II enzyme chaperone